MRYLGIGVHVWVSVLILGTLWRLTAAHLCASPNQSLNHAGKAMFFQY